MLKNIFHTPPVVSFHFKRPVSVGRVLSLLIFREAKEYLLVELSREVFPRLSEDVPEGYLVQLHDGISGALCKYHEVVTDAQPCP